MKKLKLKSKRSSLLEGRGGDKNLQLLEEEHRGQDLRLLLRENNRNLKE